MMQHCIKLQNDCMRTRKNHHHHRIQHRVFPILAYTNSQIPSTAQFFRVKFFAVIESLACKSLATVISAFFLCLGRSCTVAITFAPLLFALVYSILLLPATSSRVDKFSPMKSLSSVDAAMNLVGIQR